MPLQKHERLRGGGGASSSSSRHQTSGVPLQQHEGAFKRRAEVSRGWSGPTRGVRVVGSMTEFARGDRVAVRYARHRRGKVVSPGPEQSEVRLDGERADRVYVNEDLIKLVLRRRRRSG